MIKAELKPTILGRLGSRLTVLPEPDLGRIRVMPLGHHLPEFNGLQVKWTSDSGSLSFPDPTGALPPQLTQTLTPTATAYRFALEDGANGEKNKNGDRLLMKYKLVSPFCPDLRQWRSAPVIFLELTLTNESDTPATGALELQLTEDGNKIWTASQKTTGVLYRWEFHLDQAQRSSSNLAEFIAPELAARAKKVPQNAEQFKSDGSGDLALCGLKDDGWSVHEGILKADVVIPARKSTTYRLALAFETKSPVLKVDGTPRSLWLFDDRAGVLSIARAALENHQLIMESSHRFEQDLIRGFDTEYQVNLISLGFQSFLSNTWLYKAPDGTPRYSEWEGRPLFHNTMDVMINTTPFHLKYTSDLLADIIRHRPPYNQKNHISHDIGKGLVIGKNAYPVKMIVEEDTNFILLHYMYARATGDYSIAGEQASLLIQLTESLMNADTDSDGLPNKGTVNTFDDAPPSINSSENQLYLGIKVASALHAFKHLSRNVPELKKHDLTTINQAIITIIDTVNKSWEDDHYPINLAPEKCKRKMVVMPFNRKENANPKPMASDSSHGYSNYLAHGLVPLLMFGDGEAKKWFPGMVTHLETAHSRTNTEFGDAHRDGVTNVWISQNMWRDLAAAYLGADLDFNKLHSQYWHNQVTCFQRSRNLPENAVSSPWTGFCDSPESSFLTWYSRGIPILMLHQALSDTPVEPVEMK